MTMRVIAMDDADAVAIRAMGSQFYALNRLSGEFKPDWFLTVWAQALKSGVGALWRYDREGTIAGYLGALIHPCIFSGQTVATEAFWFVSPEYRDGSGGVKLFLEFLAWCQELEVSRIQSAHVNGSMEIELEEFYSKRGFRRLESLYVKEIP